MSATLNMNAKENNTATTKMNYLDALCILGTSKWINKQKNNSLKSDIERSGITIDPVEYVITLYQDAKVIAEFVRKYGANLTPDDEWISVLCDLALTECYSEEDEDRELTSTQELFCGYMARNFFYGHHHLELRDEDLTVDGIRVNQIALEVLARNGESADSMDVEDWLILEEKIGHEIDNEEFNFICDQATPLKHLDEENAKALDEIYAGKRPAPMTVAQLIAAAGEDAKIYQQNHGLINKSLFWDDVYVKKLYVSPIDGEVIFSTYSF